MLVPPGDLFNPVTTAPTVPLTGWEVAAGPFGLIVLLPLVPLLRLWARANPRLALIGVGLCWLIVTTGPLTTALFMAAVSVGAGWVFGLHFLRRRELLGPRLMIALVWLGLHALILPVWWIPAAQWYGWQPSRLPVLHNIGFAYFLLRFIAWGVQWARQPDSPLRLADTVCWIFYPPCMRLGPVMLREAFLERLETWDPRARTPWRAVGKRLGLFVLGMIALGITVHNTPVLVQGQPEFFNSPQSFPTWKLVSWLYLIPIQIYFLLWTYNELACGLSLWIGIPVDNNFNWLPRATSVRDFWRRWHVTVGSWLRDYIYIPLGGNRGQVWLIYIIVFGYVGVWHGPSWSFVAWGLAQAVVLIVHLQWDGIRRRLGWTARPASIIWTLVCWVLTMHYAIATIIVFTDFDHCGMRFFPELFRRLLGGVG